MPKDRNKQLENLVLVRAIHTLIGSFTGMIDSAAELQHANNIVVLKSLLHKA